MVFTPCRTNDTYSATKIYESSKGKVDTWANARAACHAIQMQLAIPTSAEENEAIRTESQSGNRIWIGISDLRGPFTDTEGNERLYTNWAKEEPSSLLRGNCVLQLPPHQDSKWNAVSCTRSAEYVCEAISEIIKLKFNITIN